jgi:hypothetical protein
MAVCALWADSSLEKLTQQYASLIGPIDTNPSSPVMNGLADSSAASSGALTLTL